MINTRDFPFTCCHRASKAPHEAGRASKPTPSIGYPISWLDYSESKNLTAESESSKQTNYLSTRVFAQNQIYIVNIRR